MLLRPHGRGTEAWLSSGGRSSEGGAVFPVARKPGIILVKGCCQSATQKTLEGAALNPQVEPSQNFRDPGAATLQRRDYNARCYEMYCINTGCAPSCELYHIKVWYELHYN